MGLDRASVNWLPNSFISPIRGLWGVPLMPCCFSILSSRFGFHQIE
uniref:Uncharacterized protein n=1 Tax=Rhizophora mucronata TaxID=61149 RepID=A0A2P2NEE4_RHIMU